eukprot:CFRG1387T1
MKVTAALIVASASIASAAGTSQAGYAAIVSKSYKTCIYNDCGKAKLDKCDDQIAGVRLGRSGFRGGNGFLRTRDGTCLGTTAPDGNELIFFPCEDYADTNHHYVWTQTNLGGLQLKGDGRCLTAGKSNNLKLQKCKWRKRQKWSFDVDMNTAWEAAQAVEEVPYEPLKSNGICLTSGRKSVVYLSEDCKRASKFKYNTDDGTLRTESGSCLQIQANFTEESVFRIVSCNDDAVQSFEWIGSNLRLQGTDKCITTDMATSSNGGTGYGIKATTCDTNFSDQQWKLGSAPVTTCSQ